MKLIMVANKGSWGRMCFLRVERGIKIVLTSLYLWKFHSSLFASSPLLYLASLLLPPPPPPPSHTPLEEACSATQNTLINMKEATN